MLTTSITLLERVRQQSDRAAWDRFVSLYSPLLFRWARRAGLTQDEAADLVQEVLLVLLRELPTFQYDDRGNFRGWLKTITINRCRQVQRKRKPVLLGDAPDTAPDTISDENLEEFWQQEYQQHLMKRALEVMQAEFEEKTWRACWEQLVGGKTGPEVAAELGITEGAAYVYKSRVLKKLREELKGLLD